jgi:hypothetical protein
MSKAIAPGRIPDAEQGLDPGMSVDSKGRLKGWEKVTQNIRQVFDRIGFSDREAVALLGGGHAYGRCHREYSGYEGAWMENMLYFSNEYVTDMLGDTWIPVNGTSKIPNGAYPPNDLRPRADKRQYIDISSMDPTKQMPGSGDLSGMRSDDTTRIPTGEYIVNTTWINIREDSEVHARLLGRVSQNTTLSILEVKQDASGAVRGRASHGGWVSIIGSGGVGLLERIGDLNPKSLATGWRIVNVAPAPVFSSAEANSKANDFIAADQDFNCQHIVVNPDASVMCEYATDKWAKVYSSEDGLIAEQKVKNWNDVERRVPIKDQYGHQMMLVSDMIFAWDPAYRKHMEDFSKDDGELLKKEFGAAYKRLTELGCPWSADRPASLV